MGIIAILLAVLGVFSQTSGTTNRPKTLRVGLVAHSQRDFRRKFATDLTALEAEVSRVLDTLSTQYALEGVLSGGQTEWSLARWCYRAERPYQIIQPFEGQDEKWPSKAKRAYQALLNHAADTDFVSYPPRTNTPGNWARIYRKGHEAVAMESDLLIAAWIPSKKGSSVEAAVKVASDQGIPLIIIELNGNGQPVRTIIRGEGVA